MASDATFYTTINTGFSAPTASRDATFTDTVNTGFASPVPSKDATFNGMENTGVGAMAPTKDATFTAAENTGFVLPPQVDVQTRQVAWGTAMTPKKTVTLIPDHANAVAYTTEGDVTG